MIHGLITHSAGEHVGFRSQGDVDIHLTGFHPIKPVHFFDEADEVSDFDDDDESGESGE